jgi:hypothetical protein
VIYYNPGGFYTLNTNKELVFLNYPTPYSAGFTNAIYAVTAMTNFGGVAFPAAFSFAQYQPGGNNRYKLDARKTAEAVVTAFRPACSRADLLPRIEDTTIVVDKRMAKASPPVERYIYHTGRGGHWLTIQEAKDFQEDRQAKRAQYVRARAAAAYMHSRGKPVAIAVFCCLLLGPLGIYFVWHKSRKIAGIS